MFESDPFFIIIEIVGVFEKFLGLFAIYDLLSFHDISRMMTEDDDACIRIYVQVAENTTAENTLKLMYSW